jgi:hypothetical protein
MNHPPADNFPTVRPLPPPSLAERLRGAVRVLRRWLDAATSRTILRAAHARKRAAWQARIDDVLACPDHAALPQVFGAGAIAADGTQTMHNGLRIVPYSYYRWRGTAMFTATGGVHEPQEERVFAEVLKFVRPGGTMVELGAYWGFYSMWFARVVPGARCVLVEPLAENLALGRANFRLNRLSGEFVRAGVGAHSGHVPKLGAMTCVDDLVAERGLGAIDVLHCDIQGFEGDMLRGAVRTLAANKVRFAFVSTHSNALHIECRDALRAHGFDIIADADLDSTYSFDGVLVGQLRGTPGPGPVPISRRTPKNLGPEA